MDLYTQQVTTKKYIRIPLIFVQAIVAKCQIKIEYFKQNKWLQPICLTSYFVFNLFFSMDFRCHCGFASLTVHVRCSSAESTVHKLQVVSISVRAYSYLYTVYIVFHLQPEKQQIDAVQKKRSQSDFNANIIAYTNTTFDHRSAHNEFEWRRDLTNKTVESINDTIYNIGKQKHKLNDHLLSNAVCLRVQRVRSYAHHVVCTTRYVVTF